jgi:hypothetical protein
VLIPATKWFERDAVHETRRLSTIQIPQKPKAFRPKILSSVRLSRLGMKQTGNTQESAIIRKSSAKLIACESQLDDDSHNFLKTNGTVQTSFQPKKEEITCFGHDESNCISLQNEIQTLLGINKS